MRNFVFWLTEMWQRMFFPRRVSAPGTRLEMLKVPPYVPLIPAPSSAGGSGNGAIYKGQERALGSRWWRLTEQGNPGLQQLLEMLSAVSREQLILHPGVVQSPSPVQLSVTCGLQHTRLPCPSLLPGVRANSRPLSRWCCQTVSSSAAPFSFCCTPTQNSPSSQSHGFSAGHVWMWELDHKESWVPKNWWFGTVVLEKTLESPLDCKEIQPVNHKGY